MHPYVFPCDWHSAVDATSLGTHLPSEWLCVMSCWDNDLLELFSIAFSLLPWSEFKRFQVLPVSA